jgi:hypothetical protein
MSSLPALTPAQKRRLSVLEPALRTAVYAADYESAKQIAVDLQSLLRSTGHETRLMQAKTWLFEAALNAGELHTAEAGFRGICAKTATTTRVHLEALSLLAVCLLRQNRLADAEPIVAQVLTSKAIRDKTKRERFVQSVSERFQLETCLAASRGHYFESLNVDEIDSAAVASLKTKSEDELYAEIANVIPRSVLDAVFRVNQASRLRLSRTELALLPSNKQLEHKADQGRCFFASLKLVIWKSLCDQKSEIYKAWFTNGVANFFSKKYYALVVTAALVDLGFAAKAVAIPVTALLMKLGIEVYCERFRPGEILDERAKNGSS